MRESSCPECGDPLALVLSTRAPKHVTFGVGIAPLMAGVLLVLFALNQVLVGSEDSLKADWRLVLIYTTAATVYGAAALALWRQEGKILRMPLRRICELCVCTWGAALGVAAVTIWAVRSV